VSSSNETKVPSLSVAPPSVDVQTSGQTWRYAPLDPAQFPPGQGPFRSRGLAYAHILGYADARLPGGRAALLAHVGASTADSKFYEQIFLVTGVYDVSPLLRLFIAAAELKKTEVGVFIQRRAARSGASDTEGVWKPALHGRTPSEVASRLNFAFARYYPPCGADSLAAERGFFEGELHGIPSCMNGLYCDSTVGFYQGALGRLGARDLRVEFDRARADGSNAGIPLERIRFRTRWDE
jgi:hypothetical protein